MRSLLSFLKEYVTVHSPLQIHHYSSMEELKLVTGLRLEVWKWNGLGLRFQLPHLFNNIGKYIVLGMNIMTLSTQRQRQMSSNFKPNSTVFKIGQENKEGEGG